MSMSNLLHAKYALRQMTKLAPQEAWDTELTVVEWESRRIPSRGNCIYRASSVVQCPYLQCSRTVEKGHIKNGLTLCIPFNELQSFIGDSARCDCTQLFRILPSAIYRAGSLGVLFEKPALRLTDVNQCSVLAWGIYYSLQTTAKIDKFYTFLRLRGMAQRLVESSLPEDRRPHRPTGVPNSRSHVVELDDNPSVLALQVLSSLRCNTTYSVSACPPLKILVTRTGRGFSHTYQLILPIRKRNRLVQLGPAYLFNIEKLQVFCIQVCASLRTDGTLSDVDRSLCPLAYNRIYEWLYSTEYKEE